MALSVTQDLLRTASRARDALTPSSRRALVRSCREWRTADGGFRGRSSESDLYYTAFGLGCLASLGGHLAIRGVRRYLDSFSRLDELDLVHLSCWLQGREPLRIPVLTWGTRTQELERFRSSDGGYARVPGEASGSVYAAYMALLGYAAAGQSPPNPWSVVESVLRHRTSEGGFVDGAGSMPTVPATSAAVVVVRELDGTDCPAAAEWLLAQVSEEGGFRACTDAPVPDLLSTATALYALRVAGRLAPVPSADCLTFVQALWDGSGFRSHVGTADPSDCEYTFYGLLALGVLAERLQGGRG